MLTLTFKYTFTFKPKAKDLQLIRKLCGLMNKTLVSLVTKKLRFESVRSSNTKTGQPKRTPALT